MCHFIFLDWFCYFTNLSSSVSILCSIPPWRQPPGWPKHVGGNIVCNHFNRLVRILLVIVIVIVDGSKCAIVTPQSVTSLYSCLLFYWISSCYVYYNWNTNNTPLLNNNVLHVLVHQNHLRVPILQKLGKKILVHLQLANSSIVKSH